MSNIAVGMLLGTKGLITLFAFASVVYSAFLLRRARIDRSAFLLFGCISMLAGHGVGLTFWTFGYISMWTDVILESMGAGAAAYGFSRIVRTTISDRRASRNEVDRDAL